MFFAATSPPNAGFLLFLAVLMPLSLRAWVCGAASGRRCFKAGGPMCRFNPPE